MKTGNADIDNIANFVLIVKNLIVRLSVKGKTCYPRMRYTKLSIRRQYVALVKAEAREIVLDGLANWQ